MGQRFLLVLQVVASPGNREAMLQSIRPLLAPTRVLRGCISIRLCQDIERPNVLSLIEEWKTEADLHYHLCSDDFRKLLGIMEMSTRRPEIKFHTISKTAGLEVVEAAREQLFDEERAVTIRN